MFCICLHSSLHRNHQNCPNLYMKHIYLNFLRFYENPFNYWHMYIFRNNPSEKIYAYNFAVGHFCWHKIEESSNEKVVNISKLTIPYFKPNHFPVNKRILPNKSNLVLGFKTLQNNWMSCPNLCYTSAEMLKNFKWPLNIFLIKYE